MAVVKRSKQESMYGFFVRGDAKKVSVVERWPLAEVRLYSQLTHFYGHPLNRDTSLLHAVRFVPRERKPLHFL